MKSPAPGNSVESCEAARPVPGLNSFSPLGKQRRMAWPAGVAFWTIRSMRLHNRERFAFPVSRASGVRQS